MYIGHKFHIKFKWFFVNIHLVFYNTRHWTNWLDFYGEKNELKKNNIKLFTWNS